MGTYKIMCWKYQQLRYFDPIKKEIKLICQIYEFRDTV